MDTSNITLSENTQHILVYEFHEVASGKLVRIDPYHFREKTEKAQEEMVLFLIKYLIEDILHWTPLMARSSLTMDILKEWGLGRLVKKIKLPADFRLPEDTYYIVKKIYPAAIALNAQDVYIQTYNRVLKSPTNGRFPKGYFLDTNGKSKACVLLKYAIENKLSASSISELYAFFGSNRCTEFLAENKLDLPRRLLFKTPVEYFDLVLPLSQRNPLLFNYYHLWALVDGRKHLLKEKRGRPTRSQKDKRKGVLDLQAELIQKNTKEKRKEQNADSERCPARVAREAKKRRPKSKKNGGENCDNNSCGET